MLPDSHILSPLAYRDFFEHPKAAFLQNVVDLLKKRLEQNLNPERNNQMEGWKAAISGLPADSGGSSPL